MVALLLLQPHILTVLSFIAQIRTIVKDLPSAPVVDFTSNAWAMGLIPGRGTKILHTV